MERTLEAISGGVGTLTTSEAGMKEKMGTGMDHSESNAGTNGGDAAGGGTPGGGSGGDGTPGSTKHSPF